MPHWTNCFGAEMGWGMGFGWILMILVWVLAIVGIVAMIRWMTGQPLNAAPEQTPLQILQQRYARGDIQRDEYEQKKQDLS